VNVSETKGYDAKVVCPKSIAPLRLLRVGGHSGRWPVRWHVVYPDGEINPLVWTTRRDAIGQAAFAAPYHAKEGMEVSDVGGANQGRNPGGV